MRLMIHAILRVLFWVFFGVRHRAKLSDSPAIVAANHNSHLDVFALFSLFPLKRVKRVHAVAAADYFGHGMKGRLARYIFGAILIDRSGSQKHHDLLTPALKALEHGDCLVIFPEGTRGKPGEIAPFKSGVGRLAEAFPNIPIFPVFLGGIERALPKGHALLVPMSFTITCLEPVRRRDFTEDGGQPVRRKIARHLEDQIRRAAEI